MLSRQENYRDVFQEYFIYEALYARFHEAYLLPDIFHYNESKSQFVSNFFQDSIEHNNPLIFLVVFPFCAVKEGINLTKVRTYFRYNRKLLGRLSRCAYETIKEMMQAALEDKTVIPGMIAAIQTFGSSDIHPPVSLERLMYDRENQQVFYQGKDQTSAYAPLDFLAYVRLHIPDKGQCLH